MDSDILLIVIMGVDPWVESSFRIVGKIMSIRLSLRKVTLLFQ